jgi:hypothetical protein
MTKRSYPIDWSPKNGRLKRQRKAGYILRDVMAPLIGALTY